MKKILSLVAIALTLLTSCYQDDIAINPAGDGEGGLTIKLSASANSELTRATQNAAEEQKINNAYIFIFNSGGGLVYSAFHTFTPQFDQVMTVSEEDVVPGEGITIAVVANIDNQIMDASESTFDSVGSLEDLESLSTKMLGVEHPLQRSSSFLMSGKLDNVTIGADNTTNPDPIDVPLVRTDAKIKFDIKVDDGTYNNIEFTPTEWRVGSYAKSVKIFDTAVAGEFASESDNYGTYTAWANFEQKETTITASNKATATFAFYGLESILAAGSIPATGTFAEQYALREKQVKNTDGTNQEAFKYAPAGSTFVEFKGAIKYTDTKNDNAEYVADVTYKVQLGGVNEGGTAEVNNFNSYRNTSYTYNVTIKGVDDIITEVTSSTGEEPRPGAEGSIVTSSTFKELDAYNSIFTYTFNKKSIDENLRWEVSTIFSQGGKKDGAKDYKWVHFRLNGKTSNAYNNNFQPYLGDDVASKNVYNSETAIDNLISKMEKNEAVMLDVDQLVEVLKRCKTKNKLFDKKGNITFTVYVKENYYDYDVTTASSGFEKMLWQKFVNTNKRVLSIISGYTQSDDKESSRAEAQVSFRQATIQTMYNTEGDGEFSGFGSQFYPKSIPSNPDGEVSFANSSKTIAKYANANMTEAKDKNNGRANCIKFINVGSDRWDKFINTATWTMKSDYDYPLYRFLLYNRDMDGDEVIDSNEIQWYIASINQLTDLWIGEDSFNPTSKLYQFTNWEHYKQHYISSTYAGGTLKTCNYSYTSTWRGKYNCGCGKSGGCGKKFFYGGYNVDVLWSSEGSSIGTLSDAGRCDDLYYRIVRNFGLENNSTKAADKIYTAVSPTSTTDGYIELSRLNSKSIRNNITGELTDHELRDGAGNNKVPRKFAISHTLYGRNSAGNATAITSGGSYTWKQIMGEESGYSRLQLPDNWRIPNQRELSLMYSVLGAEYWPLGNHFSCTGFCDTWENSAKQNRPGFAVTNQGGVLTLLSVGAGNNATGGVRPVKDIN